MRVLMYAVTMRISEGRIGLKTTCLVFGTSRDHAVAQVVRMYQNWYREMTWEVLDIRVVKAARLGDVQIITQEQL